MRVIRASEIGEYIYCHRAWWLRHAQGRESANAREMAIGTAAHASHGRTVWLAGALRALAIVLAALAVISILLTWLNY